MPKKTTSPTAPAKIGRSDYTAQAYISDVLAGRVEVCEWVKLAVDRHVRDLARQRTEAFPYYFDAKKAKRVIRFFHRYLYHIKGPLARKHEKIHLRPWQQFILWCVFGWRRVSDGFRRFNTLYVAVPKKNGKSTFLGGIGIYLTRFDGEPGAEVYSAATVKDQAKIVFDTAKAMVLKSPELQKYIHPYKHILVSEDTFSKFEAVSSDADTLDGKHVHGAIIDEYHAHQTNEVYQILRDGMTGRDQAITTVITTAGFDPSYPCFEEEEYVKGLLKGRFVNETYWGIVYTVDKGEEAADKCGDERIWRKANPNWGISVMPEMVRATYNKARDNPRELNAFRTKHLNIWTNASEPWIPQEKWEACRTVFPLEELAGARCYAAIDLSTTIDITAKVLCFPPQREWERYRFLLSFYIPSENLPERSKRDKVDYDQWVGAGFVTATTGYTVDYDYIQRDLAADRERYEVREVAYDPHNASQFITNLTKEGWEKLLVKFPQSWDYISPACKDFEKKILDSSVEYPPNPAMDWMVSCTTIKSDSKGNIHPVKPDRKKSSKRIDGVVAALMALDRAVRNTQGASVYETRGVAVV